ncbi:MAG: ATP synthase F1 subunit delta [Deltaproteobacteria bacterium]|nr:ATP synthase F1 subunit delta [Deltaproteobacteria bacterium]
MMGSMGRRYAKALLDLNSSQAKSDEVLLELQNFEQAYVQSPDLQDLMTNPAFDSKMRKQVLEKLGSQFGFSSETQQFLKLLVDRDRLVFIQDIVRAYRELADEKLGRVRIYIESPTDLPNEAQDRLKNVLEKMTKKKVILHTQVNSELLGGVLIRIQDTVYDGSLRSALNQMKEKMMRAAVH